MVVAYAGEHCPRPQLDGIAAIFVDPSVVHGGNDSLQLEEQERLQVHHEHLRHQKHRHHYLREDDCNRLQVVWHTTKPYGGTKKGYEFNFCGLSPQPLQTAWAQHKRCVDPFATLLDLRRSNLHLKIFSLSVCTNEQTNILLKMTIPGSPNPNNVIIFASFIILPGRVPKSV